MNRSEDESQSAQENKTSPAKQENTAQQAGEKEAKSKQSHQATSDIKWVPFLIGFHLVTQVLNRLLLERQAPIGTENPAETVEKGKKRIPLRGRVKAYFWINFLLIFIAAGICSLAGRDLCAHLKDGEVALESAVIMVLSFISGIIFLTRTIWIKLVNCRGFRVTNSPDDYALERTTLFAWVLLFFISFVPVEGGTVLGWIIALAFWTPIVSVVGSSWGKLKATSPNGDKIIWPLSWGKNRAGEVA